MRKTITGPLFGCIVCIIGLILNGCKKQDDFLNTKPNQALKTPTTLADLKGLLQNEDVFNSQPDPGLGEIASDDFLIEDAVFPTLSSTDRNSYTWAKEVFDATTTQSSDWNSPYQMVYYANVVLDASPGITPSVGEKASYEQIKASALFYRAWAFYGLLQTFALPYDKARAAEQPGIPLRLSSDLNTHPGRSSIAECYAKVLSDLKTALPALPVTPVYKTAPSQPAVNALLARISLAMGDYTAALTYANACLSQFSTLTDYNTLNKPTTTAIDISYLSEDIYHSNMVGHVVYSVRRDSYIDPELYNSYDPNDLRKTKFFTILDGLPQYPRFVGSYDYKGLKYDGLAVDEIYLIKAECQARAADPAGAMASLNTLLQTRWKTGTFVPYTAVSADDALVQVLKERQKELLLRGLRWTDLRRLNLESRFAVTLRRKVNGVSYTLLPNDPKYAFPIPDIEIQLGGLPQKPR
ncbi:RagB/SusD family nutrient uptake outer membrane protein [Mucilaginibacter sabulilitoris]|uniref:RagB/SusD family nutrient uptake outer membrane protein n=1 Tax=Mucilaginibacter sabulilitoris TaxID=1173583 RepID=A0ABZ0TW13_9SPHI|nr:RagB/SusD family nutrient uptake outer membrane protein [Mucilaginibacter sabulilitoris]WPU95645.1 RagB/SusD family nutrient uptake outer membrane protein [Mucilaginibacter sabulilitoris]